jgi:hypothetical protein
MPKLMFAGLFVFFLVNARAPQEPVSKEDSEWLGSVLPTAYDALMPLDLAGTRVAYRTRPSYPENEPERYFRIHWGPFPSERLEATVVLPGGSSIARQLLNLRGLDYKASFESVLVRVAIRRLRISEDECPAVRSRVDSLAKLNVTLPDDPALRLHATRHELFISTSSGTIRASMDDMNHPLVRWADETFRALMACANAR